MGRTCIVEIPRGGLAGGQLEIRLGTGNSRERGWFRLELSKICRLHTINKDSVQADARHNPSASLESSLPPPRVGN